jgi:hypothetical protein
MTFAQLARSVAQKHVPGSAVESALAALGGKAEWNLSSLDAERKGSLVSHFVRGLRNIGVHAASRIERAMLEAAGCCGAGRRVLVLKDAISLIAVRNQVHQLATAVGLAWSESMRVQSAVSDIARFVVERGGGRIEIEETLDGLSFVVLTALDIGPVLHPGTPAPTWLSGTLNIARDFRSSRSGGGTALEFWLSRPQSLVA